jgi:type II secretory pathway component PulF
VIAFFMTRWARTFGGKRFVDKFKMKMWPIGPLFMKLYMARFARTGTTLVASGVPLIQMLEITSRSINNVHLDTSIRAAIEKVKGGKALSEALENDPNFLDLVPDMLHVGSGQPDQDGFNYHRACFDGNTRCFRLHNCSCRTAADLQFGRADDNPLEKPCFFTV